MDTIQLDGRSLTIEDLAYIARNPGARIKCTEKALCSVDRAAKLVQKTVDKYRESETAREHFPVLEYGITTGFGEFKTIPIHPTRLGELQVNILLSHCAGVGETLDVNDLSNYYPADVVRAVLVLRINAFLKGCSGIRRKLVLAAQAMVNKGIIPLVPLKGSVGSSGDLAPLSHLFVAFCEAGRESKSSRFYRVPSKKVPPKLEPATGLPKIIGKGLLPEPTAKEGLALTNGASFAAAMLALAVHDAKEIAIAADIAAAMSAEALLGCARAFDARVHRARAQKGQEESAARIRTMLEGSKLLETHDTVQDPYSIRCAPAVHGASVDALELGSTVASRELNAATDNPLFFLYGERWDQKFSGNWSSRSNNRLKLLDCALTESEQRQKPYNGSERKSYSAGNFHGQPCAVAADVMAIALSEFANISERRTQLLMDKDHNRGLPSNLIPDAGVNSGFMIAQYCAAALVSENKVLAHPASVDSIPTSANSEDHNAMAPIATRKLRTILANARHTLAIELLVAAQALEWAALFHRIKTTLPQELQKAEKKYLDQTKKDKEKDKYNPIQRRNNARELGEAEKQLFEIWTSKRNRTTIAESLSPGTRAAYLRIREAVEPLIVDRVLADDIRNVAVLLAPNGRANSELIEAVRGAVSI